MLRFFYGPEVTDVSKHRGALILNTEQFKHCSSKLKHGGLKSSEMLRFFFAREVTDVSKHRGAFILNTEQFKHVSRLSQYEISESRRRC